MNNPRLEILQWPATLDRLLTTLQRTTDQGFTKMQMDDGFVHQRAKTTPHPIFKGTVSLDQAEKNELDDFYHASIERHFSFIDPHTGETVYAAFMGKPFPRRQQITIPDTGSTHDVEIVLKDITGLIEKALAHGIVHPSSASKDRC